VIVKKIELEVLTDLHVFSHLDYEKVVSDVCVFERLASA
jgi:hypothetical protein